MHTNYTKLTVLQTLGLASALDGTLALDVTFVPPESPDTGDQHRLRWSCV